MVAHVTPDPPAPTASFSTTSKAVAVLARASGEKFVGVSSDKVYKPLLIKYFNNNIDSAV